MAPLHVAQAGKPASILALPLWLSLPCFPLHVADGRGQLTPGDRVALVQHDLMPADAAIAAIEKQTCHSGRFQELVLTP